MSDWLGKGCTFSKSTVGVAADVERRCGNAQLAGSSSSSQKSKWFHAATGSLPLQCDAAKDVRALPGKRLSVSAGPNSRLSVSASPAVGCLCQPVQQSVVCVSRSNSWLSVSAGSAACSVCQPVQQCARNSQTSQICLAINMLQTRVATATAAAALAGPANRTIVVANSTVLITPCG